MENIQQPEELLLDLLPLVTCYECGQEVPDTHAQLVEEKVVCLSCLNKPEINFLNH